MRRLRALMFLVVAEFAPLFALAELTACPPPLEPPHVEVVVDGGYPQGQSDPLDAEDPSVELATFPFCAKACAALKRLGCPEAERPDGGGTCYAVCVKAEVSGKFGLHSSCVANARTVSEARACGSIRCLGK